MEIVSTLIDRELKERGRDKDGRWRENEAGDERDIEKRELDIERERERETIRQTK